MFYSIHHQMPLLLVAAGAVGICWEFLRPGMIAPGVIGSTLLLLVVPADWRVLVPVSLAIVFFALEAVFHAGGMLAVSGAVSTASAAMVLTGSARWSLAFAIPFGILTTFLFSAAIRARRNKLDGKLRS
jgi:membrane-bound ClpP family serine protease